MAPFLFDQKKTLSTLTDTIYSLLNYQFKDKALLEKALLHDSNNNSGKEFERLEFVGDACLSMVICNVLYEKTDFSEGKMSKMKALLTRKETLSEIMRTWKLDKFFSLGKSMDGKNLPDTVYADLFESTLGAIFRDGGYETLKITIENIFSERIEELLSGSSAYENPKSLLQELTMAKKVDLPKYVIVSKTGPSHNPLFHMELQVFSEKIHAEGHSIKVTEMNAATLALKRFHA